MASNSVLDTDGIFNSINSIYNTISSYRDFLAGVKSNMDRIQQIYTELCSYEGQWLGPETTFDDYNPNNPGGTRYRITYDDKFVAFNGGDDIPSCVNGFNVAYEEFCNVAQSLESTLEEARAETERAEQEKAKMENDLAAALGFGGTSVVSSVASSSGGGSAHGSSLSHSLSKFNEENDSNTGLVDDSLFTRDNDLQSTTTALSSHDSIIDSLNKSKDERFNSSNNLSNNISDNPNLASNSSSGSSSSTRSSSHSGGGFSASRGYSSMKGVTGADEKKGILSSVVASVDDIIRSSKKKKGLASSSIPILGSDKVTGSNVVPIASSIGAAGVTGIGLSSYFGKKKDEEDDDKKSDIDVANYDGNEQNLEDNTNLLKKSVVGLDDIDANMDVKAEKDSFATTDLIETDVANQVVDTEKREENLYI